MVGPARRGSGGADEVLLDQVARATENATRLRTQVVVKDLDEVDYLWSAAEWLSDIAPNVSSTDQNILLQRTLVGSSSGYISATQKRYIFTWNDLDADGVVLETCGGMPCRAEPT